MTDRASAEGLPLREGHIVVTLPSGEQYYDPPIPDRAAAEGLRALADRWEAEGQRRDADLTRHHDPVNVLAAGIYHEHAEALRAALRDTGPRPDSGISRSVIRRQNVMAGREMNKGIAGPRPDSGIEHGLLLKLLGNVRGFLAFYEVDDYDAAGIPEKAFLDTVREIDAARLSTPETSK